MVKEVKRKARIYKVINEVNDLVDIKSLVKKVKAYPIINPKEESVRGIIINSIKMPVKLVIVKALKVDKLINALAKLIINIARL